MLAKASNDFSTPTRKDSCRSNSCGSACRRCASVNRCSAWSCRRSLTKLTIGLHSCAWSRPSPHSSLACAVLLKRLMSLNASESYASWLKTFSWGTTPSPFVTASRSPRVRPKMRARSQKAQITFCVRGVISPVLSNVYLNEVDKMLEKAIETTQRGQYPQIQYARFADDLLILISSHPQQDWVVKAVEKRLREELAKLKVEINEEKTRMVNLSKGESFGFLGFEFRLVRSRRGKWRTQFVPKMKKRTALLRKLKAIFQRFVSQPVRRVIEEINPILRGWVNYFAIGHSSRCFSFIKLWVEKKVRRHLMRARGRQGFGWKRWSTQWLHDKLGIFNGYRVSWQRA